MLNMILHMPEKYPLDMVVNFDLEIDWIWTKQVVDYMESRCKQAGIKFVKIKPRKSWDELYKKYDVPTRTVKWCNYEYKLDCKKQLNKWISEQNCRPIAYIGLCADETKRFKYDIGHWKNQDVCYPLAEEKITEDVILRWAKNVPLFNGWYKVFKRQGCMICPNLTRLELAYLCKYYPDQYNDWICKIQKYEKRFDKCFYNNSIEQVDISIKNKWLDRLDTAETTEQMNIYDYL